MIQIKLIPVMALLTLFSGSAFAAETTSQTASQESTKVKYKSGKDVDFEQLLIQGELKRPEVSIVTGNVQQGTDGLLRLRKDFTDRISMDAGEEL